MKILVTGANGQVGWELARSLLALGDVVVVGREQLELAEPNALRAGIDKINPDVLVNAAAYTAVDKAEQDTELAYRINAEAPLVMAEEMNKRNGLLLHYSTDYVFDGALDRPYRESDKPCPVNVYGQSKLAGEAAIQSTGVDHLILRTSWVFAARAQNFVQSIVRLASEREQLKIVVDQHGTPTWARLIAETSSHIVRQSVQEKRQGDFVSSLYHLTSVGYTSWYGFAEEIIKQARLQQGFLIKTQHVEPIPTTEYPLPAKRPPNSTMEVTKLEQKFDLRMPHWRDTLKLCMNDFKGTSINSV